MQIFQKIWKYLLRSSSSPLVSGNLKVNGAKSYHPYISDNKMHDHHFAHLVINEMLADVPEIPVNS